jgi:hypothetical protein
MPPTVILAAASIREYFEEAVTAALDHRALLPDRATSSYLVDLLSEFAKVQEFALDRALAVVLAEARLLPPGESVTRLKQVGDNSLYLAGYFAGSLRRAELDPGYYISLGGEAYRTAAITLRRMGSGSQLVVVFAELGEEFSQFVEVLEDLRHYRGASEGGEQAPIRSGSATEPSIGDLFEEWVRSRSDAAARQLRAAGVSLEKVGKKA